MTKVVEYREIDLDELTISKGQVRTSNLGKGIEELAESIKVQGLLQPIVVCEAELPGKWEILTGQRRFLAHKRLGKETIVAAVLDGRVDEGTAKAISITENLMRRKLSGRELKDGILHLYNLYGTMKEVQEVTGLPHHLIRDYVKYPRLIGELKHLVDRQEVDIHSAVSAQNALDEGDESLDAKDAVYLAREMFGMSGVQRKNVIQQRKNDPGKPVDEVVEHAKMGSRSVQLIVTVTQVVHQAVRSVATDEEINQDDAAAALIEEALEGRGLLE